MSVANNFPSPITIPIAAQVALDTANAVNAPTTEAILVSLSALILAAAQAGLYSITYNVGHLDQTVINQLTSLYYLVVDNTNYAVPVPAYTYNISWQQLNFPATGQPA